MPALPARRKLLFSAVVTAVALVAAEGIARLLPDPFRGVAPRTLDPQRAELEPHPTRLWGLKPDAVFPATGVTVSTTPEGLRRSARPGPPGAPLILTLGDSSVFGHHNADGTTLHDELQAALIEGGVEARVQCGGIPGYSTEQTLVLLDEVGWKLGPALLVVGNLWSDLTADLLHDRDLLAAASERWARAAHPLAHSALLRLATAWTHRALGRPLFRRVTWPTREQPGVRRVPVADYAANLERILDEARARGVGAILLTPTSARHMALPPGSPERQNPYMAIQRALAAAREVPQVDAEEVFAASGMAPEALFSDRLHPSGRGQHLLAAALRDALIGAGWPARTPLPGPPRAFALPEDPVRGVGPQPRGSHQRTMWEALWGEEP